MKLSRISYHVNKMDKHRIVGLRHGASEWNDLNLFCGWVNVNLSPKGVADAASAASLIKKANFKFDVVFASILKRSQQTVDVILKELEANDIPVHRAWQLNERHYGNLTGMNRVKAVEKYGMDQVKIWRRSFDVPPPPIETDNPYYEQIMNDECYKDGPSKDEFPKTESLKIAFARMVPYWQQKIVPEIKSNKKVLLVLHGSTCRAIIKHLSNISDEDIRNVNIPNCIPFQYYLNDDMSIADGGDMSFLGDPAELKKQIQKIEDDLKKK